MTKSMHCVMFGLLLSCAALAGKAWADASEVSLAKQYGDSYLPLMVVEHHKLIEKHAEKAGLGKIKVNWITVSGGAAANDALLSGSIDFVSGGVGPMLQLWNASKGSVKGVSAINAVPLLLNTNNPKVKTIHDFTEADKIAVPAVNISMQAVILKMAAAKEFGKENANRLDQRTVAMTQADATTALMSGKTELTAHFGNSPFQYRQLEDPRIRTVLSSYDVLGGPSTFGVVWTTAKFREANPKLYKAVLEAVKEGTAMINADKKAAAQLYIDMSKSKLSYDFVYKLLTNPQIKYDVTPLNTFKLASFMHEIGQIKLEPKSWKDYFFPEIHDRPGS